MIINLEYQLFPVEVYREWKIYDIPWPADNGNKVAACRFEPGDARSPWIHKNYNRGHYAGRHMAFVKVKQKIDEIETEGLEKFMLRNAYKQS